MTEQLYRRRAGEPVQVWRVGDGEPPEWVRQGHHYGYFRSLMHHTGHVIVEDVGRMSPYDFATDYEPLPAPAPDAREALEIARDALRRISDACPATCDMTAAHGMAAVADEALARIGGGA